MEQKIYIQHKKKLTDKRQVTQRSYDNAYKTKFNIITKEEFEGTASTPSLQVNLVQEAVAKKKAAVRAATGNVEVETLPEKEESPFVNVSEVVDVTEKSEDEIDTLRKEYLEKTGKKPHHLWKEDRLKKEIEAIN